MICTMRPLGTSLCLWWPLCRPQVGCIPMTSLVVRPLWTRGPVTYAISYSRRGAVPGVGPVRPTACQLAGRRCPHECISDLRDWLNGRLLGKRLVVQRFVHWHVISTCIGKRLTPAALLPTCTGWRIATRCRHVCDATWHMCPNFLYACIRPVC